MSLRSTSFCGRNGEISNQASTGVLMQKSPKATAANSKINVIGSPLGYPLAGPLLQTGIGSDIPTATGYHAFPV